jgi:hypothetical protein
VDFDKILYGDDNSEDDLDPMPFNPVASTISELQMFKLLGRVHVLNRLVDDDEILNCCNGVNGDLCHSKMTLSVPR